VGWHTEPGEDGDPIFCDKQASIKWDGEWFCPEHYDNLFALEQRAKKLGLR